MNRSSSWDGGERWHRRLPRSKGKLRSSSPARHAMTAFPSSPCSRSPRSSVRVLSDRCPMRDTSQDGRVGVGTPPPFPPDSRNRVRSQLASRAGESHPHALPKPYVTLSDHTASDVQPSTCSTCQCANRAGFARCILANHSRAPLGRRRSRLYLLRAQRIRWASMQRSVQHNADL